MKDWELILNNGKKRVYKLNFKVRQLYDQDVLEGLVGSMANFRRLTSYARLCRGEVGDETWGGGYERWINIKN